MTSRVGSQRISNNFSPYSHPVNDITGETGRHYDASRTIPDKAKDDADKKSAPPSPVTHTANDDKVDYSSKAGNKAAQADMAIDIAAIVAGILLGTTIQTTKQVLTLGLLPWFPIFLSTDIVAVITQLAHAAVNKHLRDAAYITASFTGDQGFVTDKWVGPHPRNTTTAIMGEVSVTSQKFDALSFDKDQYKNLKDPTNATARELMNYRADELLEDQRSLSNVADERWGMLYRAQQRCIKGLAGALELKEQLANLGEIESRISAAYDNKPQALNTVASRRALYDALLLLKMNVVAARTKLRAETLELDFKPKKQEAEDTPPEEDDGGLLSPTGGQ